MKDFFAYGTLMCEDIMEEVAGCRLPCMSGVLRNYCRRSVKNEEYPALVAEAGGCVEGVVYRNVPDAAWDRLDRFEGEMYARLPAQVELSDGATRQTLTYVVRPAFLGCLADAEWDFMHFLRHGKERFQREYSGYGQI